MNQQAGPVRVTFVIECKYLPFYLQLNSSFCVTNRYNYKHHVPQRGTGLLSNSVKVYLGRYSTMGAESGLVDVCKKSGWSYCSYQAAH